jgi:hypothetical protein
VNFLKKLGNIISTVAGIFVGFSPILQREIPQTGTIIQTISKDLAAIGDAVVAAESFGQLAGLSGADKAKYLAPQVAQIMLSSTLIAGKKIVDPAKFLVDCGKLGGCVADILNDVHGDETQQVVTTVKK